MPKYSIDPRGKRHALSWMYVVDEDVPFTGLNENFYANGIIVGTQRKCSEAEELVEQIDYQ